MGANQCKQPYARDDPLRILLLQLRCSAGVCWAVCSRDANVMNSARERVFFFFSLQVMQKFTRPSSEFTEGQRLRIYFGQFSTHAQGGTVEVRRCHLTLKAELLISSIRGGSKRTIKGGVFGSEERGFINITTHGHGSENTSRRSLITRRCQDTCSLIGHQDKKENNQL